LKEETNLGEFWIIMIRPEDDGDTEGMTMPAGHRHLTYGERCHIRVLKVSGSSNKAVAQKPGCDGSTIARELKHNMGDCGYAHDQA